MKKIILWIILIILVAFLVLLVLIRHGKLFNYDKVDDKNLWHSYMEWVYKDGIQTSSKEIKGQYSIKLDDNEIVICPKLTLSCEEYKYVYNEEEERFILTDNNNKSVEDIEIYKSDIGLSMTKYSSSNKNSFKVYIFSLNN